MLPQPRQRLHPKLKRYEGGRAIKGFLAAQIFFQEPNEPDSASGQIADRITLESLISVASRAADIFERSKTEQKRELIAFVFSNLRLRGKKLEYSLRSPFDLMVDRADHGFEPGLTESESPRRVLCLPLLKPGTVLLREYRVISLHFRTVGIRRRLQIDALNLSQSHGWEKEIEPAIGYEVRGHFEGT